MTDNNESQQGETTQWLKDNMRIILSILIVVLIAGGIYSYSKRTEAPTNMAQQEDQKIAEEGTQPEDNNATIDNGATDKGTTDNETADDGAQQKTDDQASQKETDNSSVGTSQETEQSFVETAGKGDGTTVLARKALANFLEKNPDSALTAEHKIYIEDYLRKNAAFKGRVNVGTSVEFSKSLIQESIERSKKLNDKQLKNLHKYSVRVPSLS